MPQKVVKFTGINRRVNEFQGTGACEELINLRPEVGGGLRVVKPKVVTTPNVQYTKVYEHTWGDTYNQIGVERYGNVDWIKSDGSVENIKSKYTTGGVSISSAGNVLVIYYEETKEQYVYKFDNDTYKSFNLLINNIIDSSIVYSFSSSSSAELAPKNSATADSDTAGAYNAALYSAASEFNNKYPNGLCGAAVIGCTYELEDGSEVWSTNFIVANVARCNGYIIPTIDSSSKEVTVTGASRVNLHLTISDTTSIGVRKINIYASRPILQYEVEKTQTSHKIKELNLDDIDLSGQLMYYQGSVPVDKYAVSFPLKFGTAQSSEKLMDVTGGCIQRIGQSVSYNNRFHYYGSHVNHAIQQPTISRERDIRETPVSWIAYVNFNGTWKLIDRQYDLNEQSTNDFIYPMAGIKEIVFIKNSLPKNGGIVTRYDDMFKVSLSDSSAYNYSYAFDVTPAIVSVGDFYDTLSEQGQLNPETIDSKVFWKKETNAINVSAPYNPFVFPVKYSYSFGGEILDIATSYLPVSSTQVGQYPLTIFTSNGIYAMEQGDGSVLYQNTVPLQPLVITGKAAPSPYGTFFISSNNLYLLSGREVADVSYSLNGDRELGIRDVDAYKKLCCTSSYGLVDFHNLLSYKNFEDFISDATLTYDPLQNELYINSGNVNKAYAYVFNLDTKSFHKVSRRYIGSENNGRYAIEAFENGTKNIVDLHTEESIADQHILLQSRPMSLEMALTHIQRLLMLVDTKLENEQYLMLSIFGSDNLYDWKCIISAQKQKTILRQIRTNKAAKSYRDYIVLITGRVDTNTDLSDIIADYTVVNRRLG